MLDKDLHRTTQVLAQLVHRQLILYTNKMEISDTEEDIFDPKVSNKNLGGLFQVNPGKSTDLKYEAPGQNNSQVSTPKPEPAPTSNVVTVVAYLWDGSTFKLFGKIGVTLMIKNDKAFLVLFKTKQQVVSMVDLTIEPLKIEQQSANALYSLDTQGAHSEKERKMNG